MTAKFGVSAIKGLRDKSVVIMSAVHERSAPMNTLSKSKKEVTLTPAQQNAVNKITNGKGTE